jgi:hypothetical protein
MSQIPTDVTTRLAHLERRFQQTQRLLLAAMGGLAALGVAAWRPQVPDTLRTRTLVLEDAQGRKRIVVGAPIPEPAGARIMPSTGMIILDTNGVERFGVGLFPNGNMNMGFDAPPGTGNDRNRERVSISAFGDGGAEIRMLDRETWVRARLALDSDNSVALDFLNFPPGQRLQRRFNIDGMSFAQRARQ